MRLRSSPVLAALALLSGACGSPATAPDAAAGNAVEPAPLAPGTIVPRTWLAIEPVDGRGRRPFRPDAVFAKHLLDRDAPPPRAGETLSGELGEERAWEEREADSQGKLPGKTGWAYTAVELDEPTVLLARLSGASTLFVNGAGFAGDLYGYGFDGVPVALRAGRNDLWVNGVRGAFTLRLEPPAGPVVLPATDVTKPDLVRGVPLSAVAAVVVQNASTEPLEGLRLAFGDVGEESATHQTAPLSLLPLGIAKVPLVEAATHEGAAWSGELPEGTERGSVLVQARSGETVHAERTIELDVRDASEARRVTRFSNIDGSLQEFALLEPSERTENERMVLTLHGAGVDCLAQARCYAPKPGTWHVAPTNRRPFGFDWQDWGRTDAYETLHAALSLTDEFCMPVFLTGHSMGGHGVWHLAANDPSRFAAIAPSAGWRSFDTYGGRPAGALAELWHRADGASLTEDLLENLVQIPTFILHGTDDATVPVEEAYAMEALLREAGGTVEVHYEEGAGHWWDGDRSAGVDCVDWPGVFDWFDRFCDLESSTSRDRIGAVVTLEVPPLDPCNRIPCTKVEQVETYGLPYQLTGTVDPGTGAVQLETRNVRRLSVISEPAEYDVDGQRFRIRDGIIELVRDRERWIQEDSWTGTSWNEEREEKQAGFEGPFKRAFDRRFVLVHGTAGTPLEDAELLGLARHELEIWRYRGNGTPLILSDLEWMDRSDEIGNRNVILFGNADTNLAWRELLGDRSPVEARRGSLRVGEREFEGDDLGCAFVFPGSGLWQLVGVFADTGVRGTRLGYTLAPFVSGVGYPDFAAYSSEVLRSGDGGVLAAGFFDHRWRIQDDARFAPAGD